MLRRKVSAPASNSRAIISGLSEAGPRVAMILVRRERFMPRLPVRRGIIHKQGGTSTGRRRRGRPAGVAELDRPALLLAGVDLEEAVAVEAAGEAVLDAADRELALAGAHEGAAAPLAAAVVIDRVDIVEARRELTL